MMTIIVDGNNLTSVDISNIVLEKPFCEISYKHNQIKSFVNEGGFLIDENSEYGEGGMVTLSYNDFTDFPDFTQLGIPDLTLLGKVLSFGFDIRNNKWNCNADMVPFLQLGRPVIEKLWREYMDVKCYYPERLRGESIPELVVQDRLNEFYSSLDHAEFCPRRCNCTYYPIENITTVFCSSKPLVHYPIQLPRKGLLVIDFSDTSISNVVETTYNKRILKLNLRGNKIVEIPISFVKQLTQRESI